MTNTTTFHYDAIIIGGGAAGLSAALALGRARRSVLVLDAGKPRNAPASGVHNFLTRDGTPPAELTRLGRAEVESYGGVIVSDAAATATATQTGNGFAVTTAGGEVFEGRRLLVATGLTDELPNVPGLREHWGTSVLHCPYCHGWEVRDRAIGILGTGPKSVHQALLFRQWSERITLFLHTAPQPSDDELEQLAARGIAAVDGAAVSVEGSGGRLNGIRLEDGTMHAVDALVIAPNFIANTDLLEQLGVDVQPHPMGVGSFVETDPMGATSVPGVYAAGNVTDLMAQVVTSAAEGLRVGAALNADLMQEDTRDAVAVYRQRLASR
ncbi:NAD(P)/FAD-dependent oxidoreductase [Mycetocola manganoxydans]|uniref:NAD(P)/FAD-dependent oxidoreductase n=1 Tax=Mycetocola manganoxydans TaxID=699879 RepID=A0A3L6ZKY4_9MICO|nr:NAD(P)/FAD-dependent oxidoreductase [Mycetocola manganoxydans]RLP68315.1 NAD(P)/FAD-dependent oxidoreductase [Mycetocola manganoxydans]GHD43676.1 thioredoxin reductase [Mycetocola manganoxydans]